MKHWTVRLAQQAEEDYADIVRWTARHFGEPHAQRYSATLASAIESLTGGPDLPKIRARDEVAPGIRSLHVARNGRKGRYFIVLRASSPGVLDVLRILHDSMQFSSLPGGADPDDAGS